MHTITKHESKRKNKENQYINKNINNNQLIKDIKECHKERKAKL